MGTRESERRGSEGERKRKIYFKKLAHLLIHLSGLASLKFVGQASRVEIQARVVNIAILSLKPTGQASKLKTCVGSLYCKTGAELPFLRAPQLVKTFR